MSHFDPNLNQWRARLERVEGRPSDSVWERVAASLSAEAAPPRRNWAPWRAAAVAAGLALGYALWPGPAPKPAPEIAAAEPASAIEAELQGPSKPESFASAWPVASTGHQAAQAAPNPAPTIHTASRKHAETQLKRPTAVAAVQHIATIDPGPLHYYEQGMQHFATANYCQSHYHLNEARKHLCTREPLEEINRLMTFIEGRVSSECLCMAYEEANR